MGILAEAGTLLVAGGGGGIFGIIGSGIKRVFAFKEREQTHRHGMEMATVEEAKDNRRHGHEVKLHELNLQAAKVETEHELLVTTEAGSWAGMEASQNAEAVLAANFNGSKWVEDFRGATRPGQTFLLWLMVLIIFFFLPQEGREQVMMTILFCASAATLWWFGDRPPKGNKLEQIT